MRGFQPAGQPRIRGWWVVGLGPADLSGLDVPLRSTATFNH